MDKTTSDNQCEQKQLHARRSAGAGESKEIIMDKDKIIDGLRMTMDLFTFDPSTGEEKDPDDLNDLDRTTYDACKGALEILEQLPPAQPERIIHCKDCKHWIPYDWMFSEVWQSRNINDYPEDEIGCNYCDMAMKADDFCSRAERRTE